MELLARFWLDSQWILRLEMLDGFWDPVWILNEFWMDSLWILDLDNHGWILDGS